MPTGYLLSPISWSGCMTWVICVCDRKPDPLKLTIEEGKAAHSVLESSATYTFCEILGQYPFAYNGLLWRLGRDKNLIMFVFFISSKTHSPSRQSCLAIQ